MYDGAPDDGYVLLHKRVGGRDNRRPQFFAAFVVFGAVAAAQISLVRASLERQLGIGFGVLIIGLVAVAVWLPSQPLFLVGGAIAGGGAGTAFEGSVTTVSCHVT